MPANPVAEIPSMPTAVNLGQGNEKDTKLLQRCWIQRVEKSQCRMLNTAGSTVENGRVAYQKYSWELNSGPT